MFSDYFVYLFLVVGEAALSANLTAASKFENPSGEAALAADWIIA